MVNEYAIDPTCLTNWQRLRFVADAVGVHNGRLISEFPKKWRLCAERARNQSLPAESKRMEEYLAKIKPCLIPSGGRAYDGELGDWLMNAEDAHRATPFRAIVSEQNPRGQSDVLMIDEINATTNLWKTQHSRVVPRNADEMAKTASLLFQIASDIVLVDPHFKPTQRFLGPLEQFLRLCTFRRFTSIPRIRLIVEDEDQSATAGDIFEQNCRNGIAALMPTSMQCELVRICEKPAPSEKIHNRYVLTDWGGLDFGVGLDDDAGSGGESDDVHLLDKEHFDVRWRQYALMEAFNEVAPPAIIVGTKTA